MGLGQQLLNRLDGTNTMETNCYQCKYKRNVPGDAHIQCTNPDPDMTGSQHGIKKGWFFYPFCFDHTWATKECCNFESKQS